MALDFVEYQDSVTDTSGDKYEPLQEEIEENERSILLKSCHSVPPHGSVFPALITAPQLPSSSDNVSFVLHQHFLQFLGKNNKVKLAESGCIDILNLHGALQVNNPHWHYVQYSVGNC